MTATATGTPRPTLPREALLDRAADWTIRPRGALFRWSWVLGAFAAATGLRLLIDPWLPSGFPFLTYFPAIALTAVVAGTRPGAILAGLCLVASWYLFLPPFRSFSLEPSGLVALALYVVVVATEVGLVYVMRRALKRLATAEAAAREEARSRTLMFHELQHRVSNNLAVVASLLSMQRRRVSDPQAVHALDAAAARVGVVARLNRLLHDPSAQAVDVAAFLRAVAPEAAEAAGMGERVRVQVSAQPLVLDAEQAVPFGLIATELLANAFEHGFPGDRGGMVRVTLERTGDRAVLTVRDDGVGVPAGFDVAASRSLGLTVARQFAGQLDAALTIARDEGTVSRLEMPVG